MLLNSFDRQFISIIFQEKEYRLFFHFYASLLFYAWNFISSAIFIFDNFSIQNLLGSLQQSDKVKKGDSNEQNDCFLYDR